MGGKHFSFIIGTVAVVSLLAISMGVVLYLKYVTKEDTKNEQFTGDFLVDVSFLNKTWDSDYNRNTSTKYRELAKTIENDMDYAFNASFLRDVVDDTKVVKLSLGSQMSIKVTISIVVTRLQFVISDASGNTVTVRLESVDIQSAIKEGITILLKNDPSSIFSQADFTLLNVKKITDKKEEIVEECVSKTDIVFLLDESGSVGSSNFDTLKLFVSEFASKSDINKDTIQMGVVTFSSSAKSKFRLNEYQSAGQIVSAMNKVVYSSGGTNIGGALKFVYDNSFKNTHGGRPGAFKVLVLMTDGQSGDASFTAGLLKNSGVTIICIGIGGGIKTSHLNDIASQESLVFYASDFNTLSIVQNITLTRSCEANYTEFGDIMKLKPTGKEEGGVARSESDVKTDIADIMSMKSCFLSAGRANGIHPALIAAIASRESRAGRLLEKTDGWGTSGDTYGIMQCNESVCPVCAFGFNCTYYPWNSCEHIRMMTNFALVSDIKQVQKEHPTWNPEQQIQGGVAAFDVGVTNLKTWNNLDRDTTGRDYSNDVIARAQYLINNYDW